MFVVLSKFTDQGARNIQNLRKFAEENMARGARLGLKIHGWYLTQGRYDVVVIVEAPDAETMWRRLQAFGRWEQQDRVASGLHA